jgi:nitrite reductase (NADH) small subunit/3-phenylpropionate/trans-cinnamate dioxygenase ferredoxin subunit
MSDFRRVLLASDLPPGGGFPADVGNHSIAVFNVDGRFFAIDNVCPHRGGPLSDGALRGTIVSCPLHHWQFDVTSGRNPMTGDLNVRSFPVEVRDGWIFVDIG